MRVNGNSKDPIAIYCVFCRHYVGNVPAGEFKGMSVRCMKCAITIMIERQLGKLHIGIVVEPIEAVSSS